MRPPALRAGPVGVRPATSPATIRRWPGPLLRRAVRGGLLVIAGLLLAGAVNAQDLPQPGREFRVCADPNNLPFSNRRGEGFENRIAEIVAREMGAGLRYHWIPQRRGWVRRAMREEQLCDVAIGIPSRYELLLPTRAYYRSSYAFVYRKDRSFRVRSFDDAVLRQLRIGVHLIGGDYQNTPPAHALSRRGLVDNVVGYSMLGDYSEENPPARLIEAVARGDIDLAIAWGPIAGYFAQRQGGDLEVVPVSPEVDRPSLPFVFDISLGVRWTEGVPRGQDAAARALKEQLETILDRRHSEIRSVLDAYGVPLLAAERLSGVAPELP